MADTLTNGNGHHPNGHGSEGMNGNVPPPTEPLNISSSEQSSSSRSFSRASGALHQKIASISFKSNPSTSPPADSSLPIASTYTSPSYTSPSSSSSYTGPKHPKVPPIGTGSGGVEDPVKPISPRTSSLDGIPTLNDPNGSSSNNRRSRSPGAESSSTTTTKQRTSSGLNLFNRLSPQNSNFPQSVQTPMTAGSSSHSHKSGRVPSRHLLQSALDLAQRAVELDRSNDVTGALDMYREAVSRLRSVMERVGIELEPIPSSLGVRELSEDRNSAEKKKRRGSAGRSEEEGRTLKGIHDAYIARIGLLTAIEVPTADPVITTRPPSDGGSSSFANPATSATASSSDATATARQSMDSDSTTAAAAGIGNLMLNGSADDDEDQSVAGGHSRESSGEMPSVSGDYSGLGSALRSQPVPRKRVTSLGQAASARSSREVDPDTPMIAVLPGTPNGPLFANNPVDDSSPRSSRGERRKRLMVKSNSKTMGLDEEAGVQLDDEGMEMLDADDKAKASSEITLNDDRPISGELKRSGSKTSRLGAAVSSPRNSGLADDASSIRSFNNNAAAPMITPRRASLELPAEEPNSAGSGLSYKKSHRRKGSISSTVPSVPEEEEDSFAPEPPSKSPVEASPLNGGSPAAVPIAIKSATVGRSFGEQIAANELTRSRSASQPGNRPSKLLMPDAPLPNLPIPRSPDKSRRGLRPVSSDGASTVAVSFTGRHHVSLPSPSPEPAPKHPVHRPFHLLRLIRTSIISPTGGFISDQLHIPRSLWSQAGVKLPHLDTKVRILELLIVHLSTLARYGEPLLGQREKSWSAAEVSASGKEFSRNLEEFEGLLEEVQKMSSKKFGITDGGFKAKKPTGGISSWGNKFSKSLDRMTNGKSFDTPTAYVDSLSRLCYEAQILDQHLLSFTGYSTPAYDLLSLDTRTLIEARLRRTSEFFGAVVLAFVIQDVEALLSRYLKLSGRWLED